jgi:hypothetical protein
VVEAAGMARLQITSRIFGSIVFCRSELRELGWDGV